MTIYNEMQEIASSLLSDSDFKQGTMRLVKLIPGNGPADNPGKSTKRFVDLPGGVARGVSFKYVKDGLALSTDKTAIIPVVEGETVDGRDFLEIDGVQYKIVQDISTPSAGVRVVWKLIVRKC